MGWAAVGLVPLTWLGKNGREGWMDGRWAVLISPSLCLGLALAPLEFSGLDWRLHGVVLACYVGVLCREEKGKANVGWMRLDEVRVVKSGGRCDVWGYLDM